MVLWALLRRPLTNHYMWSTWRKLTVEKHHIESLLRATVHTVVDYVDPRYDIRRHRQKKAATARKLDGKAPARAYGADPVCRYCGVHLKEQSYIQEKLHAHQDPILLKTCLGFYRFF